MYFANVYKLFSLNAINLQKKVTVEICFSLVDICFIYLLYVALFHCFSLVDICIIYLLCVALFHASCDGCVMCLQSDQG